MTKQQKVFYACEIIEEMIKANDPAGLALLYTGVSKRHSRHGYLPPYLDPNKSALFMQNFVPTCRGLKLNTIQRYRQEWEAKRRSKLKAQ